MMSLFFSLCYFFLLFDILRLYCGKGGYLSIYLYISATLTRQYTVHYYITPPSCRQSSLQTRQFLTNKPMLVR